MKKNTILLIPIFFIACGTNKLFVRNSHNELFTCVSKVSRGENLIMPKAQIDEIDSLYFTNKFVKVSSFDIATYNIETHNTSTIKEYHIIGNTIPDSVRKIIIENISLDQIVFKNIIAVDKSKTKLNIRYTQIVIYRYDWEYEK